MTFHSDPFDLVIHMFYTLLFNQIISENIHDNETYIVMKFYIFCGEFDYINVLHFKVLGSYWLNLHYIIEICYFTLCRLCVIAGNISPIDVITHVPILCEENGVPYIYVPSKEVGSHFPCF
jgi:hypothetical protein